MLLRQLDSIIKYTEQWTHEHDLLFTPKLIKNLNSKVKNKWKNVNSYINNLTKG